MVLDLIFKVIQAVDTKEGWNLSSEQSESKSGVLKGVQVLNSDRVRSDQLLHRWGLEKLPNFPRLPFVLCALDMGISLCCLSKRTISF